MSWQDCIPSIYASDVTPSQFRSLVERNGESAFSYVRVFKILEVARDLVNSGKLATQRDIYYRLLAQPIFTCTR